MDSKVGGDGRIRTADGGFADPCLNHLATSPGLLVPRRGFEPLRPKARPPQDRVSTYSTTSALPQAWRRRLPLPDRAAASNLVAHNNRHAVAIASWQEWRDSNPRPAVLETSDPACRV